MTHAAPTPTALAGLRIFVAEDTALVAETIALFLRRLGCVLVGPYPTLQTALDAARVCSDLNAALLDINLDGEFAFPIADELSARAVPVIFLTGYAAASLPSPYRDFPLLEKPFSSTELQGALSRLQTVAHSRLPGNLK